MRLFVAIGFGGGVRARLAALSGGLRARCGGGSFVPPENLHLTLAFLGECGEGRLPAVRDAVGVAGRSGPFDFRIDRVGRSRRGGGDVWWAGVEGCAPLMDLQRALAAALAAAGSAPAGRGFMPHVTLARRVPAGPRPWPIEPFGGTARGVDLMESRPAAGGPTYAVVWSQIFSLPPGHFPGIL